ncbi:MAG: AAA family ATPase [Clostridia bacterium]
MQKFKTITGKELLEKEIEQIPFVVNEILPIGLSLLAGESKIGKSWLSLWLSVQVAKGEKVWNFDSCNGTVLYLCFEDNEIRIQNRLIDITEDAPSNVHFCIDSCKLGGEIENKIQNFITEHKNTNLIIIDTLQTIRPDNRESNYSNDYSDLRILKRLADENKIAIVLIHHFRKTKSKDIFDMITGSTGLQGAVDTMFTLSQSDRGNVYAVLKMLGRDVLSRELELKRNEDNVWEVIADSESETTLENKRFIKTICNFMLDKENFIGTATELSNQLTRYSEEVYSNKKLSKNIKKLSSSLEKNGIMSSTRRSNGIRLIELINVNAKPKVA